MKSYMAKPETTEHKWYVVDATDKPLGRLATQIAHILRGKHKPEFTPHVDTGDFVVVINAEKIGITGNKRTDKKYVRYTGFPGGTKEIAFDKLLATFPGRTIEMAVKGMLPKNPLGFAMYRKLKVYAGTAHPHQAQNPIPLEINI